MDSQPLPTRSEDFKAGISAQGKTQVRKEQGETLRKQKRGDKLMAKRRTGAPVHGYDGKTFAQVLAQHFHRAAFLAGNVDQLRVLYHLVCIMDTKRDWTEEHSNVLGVDVMNALMRFCTFDNAEVVTLASCCIANLCSVQDDRPSQHFLKSDYLKLMSTHLITPAATHDTHVYAYEALYNMILSIHREWVAVILESPFMGGFQSMRDETGSVQSPFFMDVSAVFEKEDAQLMSVIMALVATIYETPGYVPPHNFSACIWRYVHKTLLLVQPRAKADMDDTQRSAYDCATFLLDRIVEHMAGDGCLDQCRLFSPAPYLAQVGGGDSLLKRIHLLYKTCGNLRVQQRLSSTLATIAGSTKEREALQRELVASQCVPDLLMYMLESSNELIRVNAVALAGHYASDGTLYVARLKQMRALPILYRFVTKGPAAGGTKAVMRTCCAAYMSMFRACDHDRRNNMQMTQQSHSIMLALIKQDHLVQLMCSFLPQGGSSLVPVTDFDLTIEILQLIETALTWNKEEVRAQLEDSDFITAQLPSLVGHASTPIFNVASRIDDLLEDREPGHMEVERIGFATGLLAQQQQQQQQQGGAGVFMGSFNF